MQKLVFLAQEELSELDVGEYRFEPDSYGPFSRDLYDDIDSLVAGGYVEEDEETTPSGNTKQVYELTDKGEMYLNTIEELNDEELPEEELKELKEEYNSMALLKLLKRVYDGHPDMTVNSELNLA
ncbi:helix-turn-helix transcriptional regulator [Halosegnis marinus]